MIWTVDNWIKLCLYCKLSVLLLSSMPFLGVWRHASLEKIEIWNYVRCDFQYSLSNFV